MINLWAGIPFYTINILAGLKSIDQELYEAAAIDGAGAWRQFLHITLPGLRYVLIVTTLLSTIWTFNTFTLIFLLTGGGPMKPPTYTISSRGDISTAASMACQSHLPSSWRRSCSSSSCTSAAT